MIICNSDEVTEFVEVGTCVVLRDSDVIRAAVVFVVVAESVSLIANSFSLFK